MAFNLKVQLEKEKQHNKFLDKFFARWFEIELCDWSFQKIGVDRIFVDKETRMKYTVEYKSDEKASKTNNLFCETVSVDNESIPGWVYTSIAQLLVYYIPPSKTIYVISMVSLKQKIRGMDFPTRIIPNQDKGRQWNTIGQIIPLSEVEEWPCVVVKKISVS